MPDTTIPAAVRRLLADLQPAAPLAQFGAHCWLVPPPDGDAGGEHGLVVPVLDRHEWRYTHPGGAVRHASERGLVALAAPAAVPQYLHGPVGREWRAGVRGRRVEVTEAGLAIAPGAGRGAPAELARG